jgi:hypothetical protein
LLSDIYGVDHGGVARNLTNAVPAIGRNAVPEPFPSIAHRNYALAVSVPSYVFDGAGDDVVFSLGVLRADGVPDTDGAAGVAGGNVEA